MVDINAKYEKPIQIIIIIIHLAEHNDNIYMIIDKPNTCTYLLYNNQ